ncbi:MAG: aminotransferase class IV [Candidatus Omnitrophica bacterium]|nr:aminotransferase class IV [Candidatus Omnitrophota bacterium]
MIILDGQCVKAAPALLHQLTPGVRQLDGVFETMLATGGGVRHFNDHFSRLCRGLRLSGIHAPWTKDHLARDLARLIPGPQPHRVRVMVWRERGRVRFAIVAVPYVPPQRDVYEKGVKVLVLPVSRKFKKEDGTFKTLDYGLYRQAGETARRQGCFEALLADKNGRIIDGSRTSLMVLTGEGLIVPCAGFGTFDGLTRRRIMGLARKAGFRILRRHIDAGSLAGAQGVWLLNSLIGAVCITEIKKD